MGDTAPMHPDGLPRRRPRQSGSSLLTPPTGMPALPDLGTSIPTQRAGEPAAPSTPSTPPAQPVRPTVVEPCACGHAREAHEHYRPGSDCGVCGAESCAEFRAEGGAIRKLFRKFGLTA
ncbi:hypothetical protein [Pseudonocardia nigra]|uniref:hypothetical protein n=1 Tax=Pseudonocardia nigra TaxID=1921578 RepID=UPI001C5D64CF|nr:hypothetical protein [Pseudonocardia nigra]